MKKQIPLFFAILATLFFTLTASGQGEWKWAHYWSGRDGFLTDYYNTVSRTAFDDEGNIYVFGEMGGLSTFDGQRFQYVNDVPAYSLNRRASLLAKFDTLGNMLWYKVVKASTGAECFAHWMEVKDNRVYVSGNYEMDYVDYNDGYYINVWSYYFDTLIRGVQVFEMPVEERTPPYKAGRYTYIATFDLDGNLLDNHFVEARARRISGGGIRGFEFLCNGTGLGFSPMHIDNDGNTYIYTKLEYAGFESDPYTIIIDDDTNRTYDLYLPGTNSVLHTGMMYKFSPDWELVYGKPMVHHTEGIATSWEWAHDSVNQRYNLYIQGMSFDENDNMYVSGYIRLDLYEGWGGELHQYPIHIFWDSTHYATILDESSCQNMPFVVKYSPDGEVLWCNQIYTMGSDNPNNPNLATAYWLGCKYSDHHLYLIGKGTAAIDGIIYFDDTTHILQVFAPFNSSNSCNTGFFVGLDSETGQYVNQGIVPAMRAFPEVFPAVINNRLFAYTQLNDLNEVISEWCTNGEYIKSDTIFSSNVLEKAAIIARDDGHLLVSFRATSPVTFSGNVSVNCPTGCSSAVFALYHNPEFATPYVGIADRGETLSNLKLWPNPANNILYVESDNIPIDYITIMDLNGKTLVKKAVGDISFTVDVTRLPAGTYLLETVREGEVSVEKFVKTNY